jgi:hypothetical protein
MIAPPKGPRHTEGIRDRRRMGRLLLLFIGFDLAVGAIFGRAAFTAVCPVTTVLMVLLFNQGTKGGEVKQARPFTTDADDTGPNPPAGS